MLNYLVQSLVVHGNQSNTGKKSRVMEVNLLSLASGTASRAVTGRGTAGTAQYGRAFSGAAIWLQRSSSCNWGPTIKPDAALGPEMALCDLMLAME